MNNYVYDYEPTLWDNIHGFFAYTIFNLDTPYYPNLALLIPLAFFLYNETLAFLYKKTRHLDLILAKPVLAIAPGSDSIWDDEGDGFMLRVGIAAFFLIWVWIVGIYQMMGDEDSWVNNTEGFFDLLFAMGFMLIGGLASIVAMILAFIVMPVVSIWLLITIPFFIYASVVSILSMFVEHPATEEVEKHIRGERVSGRDLAEKLRVRVNFKTPRWKTEEIRKKAESLSGLYKAHKDIGKGFVGEERRRTKERED